MDKSHVTEMRQNCQITTTGSLQYFKYSLIAKLCPNSFGEILELARELETRFMYKRVRA